MLYKSSLAGVVLASVMVSAIPANADTIYTYTGNVFTLATGPYTTSDFVTLTFDLPSPLAAGLFDHFFTPTSYTISDGVQTYTAANSTGSFSVTTTNLTAQILHWDMLVSNIVNGSDFIRTTDGGDIGTFITAGGSVVLGDNTRPGTWTQSSGVVTPLPAALPLFAGGLGALGLLGWRRKRKAQAAI